MRQGEIRERLDTASPIPKFVLVLSGDEYLATPMGRVIVCGVLPGASLEGSATGLHRVSYTVEGVTTIGFAVPEQITWLLRSGLGEPVGLVTDMRPILTVVNALFE